MKNRIKQLLKKKKTNNLTVRTGRKENEGYLAESSRGNNQKKNPIELRTRLFDNKKKNT